jgi:hypothetical protein
MAESSLPYRCHDILIGTVNDAFSQSTSDRSRPVATGPDQSRQAATADEYLSIKEAQAIFTTYGRAVTERTLQRYCDKRHLDGQKRMTDEGEKWFVTLNSVLGVIAESVRNCPLSDELEEQGSGVAERPELAGA